MSITKTDVLVLDSKRYYLDKVMKIGASGPVISINIKDLNEDLSDPFKVDVGTRNPFHDDGSIVLYKQQGKYTIILGKTTYQKEVSKSKFAGIITGHLLSSVAMKKARVE